MNDPITICDFLEQGGAQVSFFDMGRRVVDVPLDTMRRFEMAEAVYPFPFLQNAWLGILFHYPDEVHKKPGGENNGATTHPHNIWFIKLPLDEQGLLQQAARDDFLRHIIKTVDHTLTNRISKEPQQQVMENNPHGFTPREDRMAVFHARVSKLTGNPPSQFYAHAMDYFAGKPGYDQWNFVGLQGIADVAARLDENNNHRLLVTAIPQLPTPPFSALCNCLENSALEKNLTKAIAARISKALNENDAMVVAAGIRGLSHSTDRDTVFSAINSVLKTPVGRNVEVLAAIAGRAWEILEEPTLRFSFLENLAISDAGQQAFDSIIADLLFLPGLRQMIKEDFRKPGRSEQLATAIGQFMSLLHST